MDCFHGGALCLSCFLNLLAYLLLQVQFMFACCVFFGVTFEILTKTGGHNLKPASFIPTLLSKYKEDLCTRKVCLVPWPYWFCLGGLEPQEANLLCSFPQNELSFKSWGAREVVSQGEPLSEISHQNHFSEGFNKISNWFPSPTALSPPPCLHPNVLITFRPKAGMGYLAAAQRTFYFIYRWAVNPWNMDSFGSCDTRKASTVSAAPAQSCNSTYLN